MKVYVITNNPANVIFDNKDIEPIFMDDLIELNNRELSVQAYEQIRKRDQNNLHVIEFKRKIIEKQIEKIESSDAILIYDDIDPDVLFQMSVARYLSKRIYIMNKPDKIYNDIINGFNVINLKGDLNGLKF